MHVLYSNKIRVFVANTFAKKQRINMKTKISILMATLFILLLASQNCAQESVNNKEIQILLTIGGHDLQEKPFFEMFDNLPGIKYHCIQLPDSAELLKPGLEKKFDVIVMYDMVKGIDQGQQESFIELLKKGIGVVSLHHNLGAHRDWDEYACIIGGKYVFEPTVLNNKKHEKSNYAHDQDFLVKIADKNHPITKGISDFKIHDEIYINYYTSPDAHVVLKTDFSKSDPEIGWVTKYEKSPVFYLLLGHDSKAWSNPNYPKLLLNAIRWAAVEGKAYR